LEEKFMVKALCREIHGIDRAFYDIQFPEPPSSEVTEASAVLKTPVAVAMDPNAEVGGKDNSGWGPG
jgi:hypothetical protein